MQNCPVFQVAAHAKCILTGEFSVLHGYPALVAPVQNKKILLSYYGGSENIAVDIDSPFPETFLHFFWSTMKQCLAISNRELDDIHGKFYIKNSIEMGSGLGFSAALCVVLTRWIVWERWLKSKKAYHFARNLENFFHGKNSGIDIIGVMSTNLVRLEKSGSIHSVSVRWHPKLYLSYSGISKNTKMSVDKVRNLTKNNPIFAKRLNEEMRKSVLMLEEALALDERHGLNKLILAIELGNHCFKEWRLITPELQQYINKLNNMGAIAVKPTGIGEGGYVLSLWDHSPVENNSENEEFIAVF